MPSHMRWLGWCYFVLLDSVARPANEMVIVYCYGASAGVNGHLFVSNPVNWSVDVTYGDTNTVI